MIRKIISLILVVLHILTFGYVRDGLAILAESTNYKLDTAVYAHGSNRNSTLYKITQDTMGQAGIGVTASSGYKATSGYIYTIQSNPPELAQPIPNQTWRENETLTNAFDLDDYFTSPDGLTLSYSVSGNTNVNVSIDPTTHIVSFSQPQDYYGVEKVTFLATDSEKNTAVSNKVVLQVENPDGDDKPAILEATLAPSPIREGDLITMTVKAQDLDGQDITFSYSDRFTQTRTYKEGTFWFSEATWQTDSDDDGHYTIRVTAQDTTGLTDTLDVSVNVGNSNQAPVLDLIPDITINENDTAIITAYATDQDNDTITYYYDPPFNSLGRWQTDYTSQGTYNIKVTASDGIDTVYQTAKVIVNNVNQSPQAENFTITPATAGPNDTITISFNAADIDEYDNTLNFILNKINRTTNAQETISQGTINNHDSCSRTTTISQTGYYIISLTLTDTQNSSTTQERNLHIYDPNTNRDSINPVMGDFNGDALSDLGLHNSDTGTWEICISERGNFPAAVGWLTDFGTSRDWWPIGGDFNGDGRTDIGIYNNTNGQLKVALSDGTKFTAQQNLWLTFSSASYSWIPFTGNFNGDKYTDFGVYNKETGEIKISKGTGSGFSEFTTWLTSFGTLDYIPLTGDFNADGLTDIAIFKKSAGEFKVAFSNIKAFIAQQNPWLTNYATDKDSIIADFNNDGLTDIGYFDKSAAGKWYYAVNTTTGFTDSDLWLEGFGNSSDESGHTGDFNGDGLTDAATFDKDQTGIYRWRIKLSTKQPTDLLVEIDNGTGGKTQVTYTYAAEFDNALLPFPVYVVSQISAIDTLPTDQPQETYTQNFTYEGGWFDATEREFRGFRKIKVTDPITGNYTETYFYQGKPPQDGALKGQIEKIIAYDATNKKISEALNTWEVRKAGPTDGVLGFPYLKEVTQTVYEIGEVYPITTKNEFTYDNLGNIIQEICSGDITTTGDEKSTETTYALAYEQGHNRPLEVTLKDKDGNVVNNKLFEYDSSGNLIKETAPNFNPITQESNNSITQYSYDSFGNVTSTTNAENHTVLTDYESIFYTYPETITNELGHTISYTYNTKFGVVTHLTDVNSNTTETFYDTLGRITAQENTQGQVVTNYSYLDFNTKVTISHCEAQSAEAISKTEYVDGLGRKYRTVSDGEDGTQKRQVSSEVYFDSRGLTEKESLPHYIDEDPLQISYITYKYDKRGRVIETTQDFPGVLEDAASYIYYINPLYIESTDPKGVRKGTQKDVYGNTIEIIEFTQEGTYHTYYEYDLKGNLIKLTDSKGNITQIQYDSLGRKTLLNDPDTGITTYTYDKLGNLLTQTDNKGQTIIMEYDALSRLIAKRGLTPQVSVPVTLATYEYDDVTKSNCLGRLSQVRGLSPQGTVPVTTSYFYDFEGRAIKLDKTIDGQVYTTQTTYDLIGRTTSITYPDGEIVSYAYDTNSGLLESVRGLSPQGTVPVTYVQDITYNAKGQIKTINYGNNTQTNYTYGQDLRLSRILTSTSTSTLQDLNYDFDKSGNITTLTDNLRSNIRTYTYDDLNRLTKAENTPDPVGGYTTFNYQYDSTGNMTYKSDLGFMVYGEKKGLSPQGTVPITAPHAVTTAGSNSYSYNENGNMLSAPNKLMTYDVENRLIKLEEPNIIHTFTYDVDGSRLKKNSSNSITQVTQETLYISSLFEKDSSGETRKYIFAGVNRVASITTNAVIPAQAGIHYYHSDHLGSSNVITNEAGEQVSLTEYTPYGTIAKQDGSFSTPYKFTGKELDNTGLYYYGARYYDPVIGRFVTPDTYVQDSKDPQTLNRYSYALNNPLIYTDPSGHFAWFVAAIIGAIVGAISGAISAHQVGGNVLAGALFGAVVGAITGAVGYGVGQSMGQAIMAATNAPLNFFEGALVTGMEFGIGGFGTGMAMGFAGGQGSFSDVMKGGLRGFVSGFAIGAIIGGTYAMGWQSMFHGFDSLDEAARRVTQLYEQGYATTAQELEEALVQRFGQKAIDAIDSYLVANEAALAIAIKSDAISAVPLTEDPIFNALLFKPVIKFGAAGPEPIHIGVDFLKNLNVAHVGKMLPNAAKGIQGGWHLGLFADGPHSTFFHLYKNRVVIKMGKTIIERVFIK